MKAKLQEQELVKKLREKGWSYKEIQTQIKVAKSSISLWCKDIKLTTSQTRRLKNKRAIGNLGALANKLKRQNEIKEIQSEAYKDISKLTLYEFKLIGAGIYWGEGDKRHSTGITNSDPKIIKFMMKWFRQICKVPEHKFRISIYYHAGQNEEEIRRYWSTITKITLNQFHKSIFKKEGTGHRKNILYRGTCKIRICDENLRHKILAWIEKMNSMGVRSSVGRASGS